MRCMVDVLIQGWERGHGTPFCALTFRISRLRKRRKAALKQVGVEAAVRGQYYSMLNRFFRSATFSESYFCLIFRSFLVAWSRS